ncbi:MAG: GMC family oxidoreductase [Bacteriovoracia bacterium]
MNEMNRRDFVKSIGAVTLAGTALSGLSIPRFSFATSDDEFDYIVIGSGAGGGPVACNLARAGYRVLILEAGGNYAGQNYRVPVLHGKSTEDEKMSWDFYVRHYSKNPSRDSKYVSSKDGVLYPRAATLGGCTAHNAMITLYPDNRDWDEMVRLTGDSSWNHRDMRSYYQKVEKASYLKKFQTLREKRGTKGWLNLEQTNPLIALKDKRVLNILLAAAEEDGILNEILEKIFLQRGNIFLDPNSWSYVANKLEGLFNIPRATNNGQRNGTREHILRTLREFPSHLELRTHALATRLIFDEVEPGRIKGVEYLSGANLYEADPLRSQNSLTLAKKEVVFAGKEVILAGGAFNSPQLLMLSGIGDKTHLEQHGIKPRIHLPGVGKNLQDRYEVGVVTELNGPLELLKDCTFGESGDPCMVDYREKGKDSVYATNGVLISIFKKSRKELQDPDLCIFGVPGDFRGYYPGWSDDAYKKDRFTWAILKSQTKNTAGSVTLKSNNPLETPDINFRYFGEGNDHSGSDLDDVVEGIKYVRRINSRARFQKISRKELVPGAHLRSEKDLKDFVTREAWGHHASCSNKMGAKNDAMAVVDSEFLVRGTKNLRIVDASIFPKIPGLFIVVPIYMAAEKASEVILKSSLRHERRSFLTLR